MKFTLSQDKYYLISLPAYLLQFGREATPTNLLLFSYDRIENRVSNNFVVKRFSKLVWILEGDWHNMVGLLPFVHSMFTTLLCCGGQVVLLAYLMYNQKSSPASLVLEFEIWRLKVITNLISWQVELALKDEPNHKLKC